MKMNEKYKIFKKGQTIVDLVCHSANVFPTAVLLRLEAFRDMHQAPGHR